MKGVSNGIGYVVSVCISSPIYVNGTPQVYVYRTLYVYVGHQVYVYSSRYTVFNGDATKGITQDISPFQPGKLIFWFSNKLPLNIYVLELNISSTPAL